MTNDPDTVSARIEAMEVRIAHQDRTIEDLNKSVTEQWRQIEALGKQLERMAARVQEVEANTSSRAPEPPPPHY